MEDQSNRRDEIVIDSNMNADPELSYELEFPLSFPNLGSQNDHENELQMIILKAFITENEGAIENVKLQIFSDRDLYFLYFSDFTSEAFESLKESQSLDESLDFEHFPSMIHEIIAKVAEDKEYIAKFEFVNGEEKGKLTLSQKLKFKEVEILNLIFEKAKDEEIANQIQERYDAVRNELKAAKAELNDLYTMLKIKNPNVLKQMRHKK